MKSKQKLEPLKKREGDSVPLRSFTISMHSLVLKMSCHRLLLPPAAGLLWVAVTCASRAKGF